MKKITAVYSQYINVDVSKKGEKEEYVRACKIEDFTKWALEKKNTEIKFQAFWLGHPAIMEFLSEYLQMKIQGWEIPTYFLEDGDTLIENEEGYKIFNQEGRQLTEEEIKNKF
jgi:hypothetical protein